MINLALYLLVMAGLIYTGILYGSMALVLTAFAGVFFAAFAYLYLLIQWFCCRCSFTVPIAMIEIGEAAEAELTLSDKRMLPVSKMRISLTWKQSFSGEHGRKQLKLKQLVSEKGNKVIYVMLEGKRCGNYEYRIRSFRIYDLTGMFYLKKRCRIEADFCVMPKIYQAAVQVTEASRHFIEDMEPNGGMIAGDGTEVLEIRPFQEGDKIQRIHWKMSAKCDALMVREYGGTKGCAVLLLLDVGQKKKRLDKLITLVSSLSFSLIEERCTHYIAWYSKKEKDIIRYRIDNEEKLYSFLLTFYREGASFYQGDIRTDYWEKFRGETAMTELFVNDKMELYQGERQLFALSGNHLEKEIEEVELIV